MYRNIFIGLIVISICLGEGGLKDIRYIVRNNGIEIHLSYSVPVYSNDIIAWSSDRSRLYITLLDIKPPGDKFPNALFSDPISSLVLDELDGSTQLSIMFKKKILGYEVQNISDDVESIIFIHLNNTQPDRTTQKFQNKTQSSTSGFPEYKSMAFREAFDLARVRLGPNAIFKYEGRIFVTNHPYESFENFRAGLQSKQERASHLKNVEKVKNNFVNKSFHPEIILNPINPENGKSVTPVKDEGLIIDEVFHELTSVIPDTFFLNEDLQPPMLIQDAYQVKKAVSGDFSIVNEPGFEPSQEIKNSRPGKLPALIQWIDLEYTNPADNDDKDWIYPKKIKYTPMHPGSELNQNELDQEKWYQVQDRFSESVDAGIRVLSNVDGVPVYIDGNFVGETPLKGAVKVKPGLHQVSGFTPVYARVIAHDGLYDLVGHDPITTNNKSFGSKSVYVDPGNVMVVNLKFNRMGPVPKKLGELTGGMFIGFPVIMALFGLITWGMI